MTPIDQETGTTSEDFANAAESSAEFEIEIIIELCRKLEELGHTGPSLDLLYAGMDVLCCDADWEIIDNVFEKIHPATLTTNISLCLLITTKPCRDRLKHRTEFLEKFEKSLKGQKIDTESLLYGLK